MSQIIHETVTNIYSDKLAHVQVVINCLYSVVQLCTSEDTLAYISGALSIDQVMSYNLLTTFDIVVFRVPNRIKVAIRNLTIWNPEKFKIQFLIFGRSDFKWTSYGKLFSTFQNLDMSGILIPHNGNQKVSVKASLKDCPKISI